MAHIDILDNIISTLDSIRSLEQIKRKSNIDVTALTKSIYDITKEQSCKKERSYRNTNALPELVIEGFDEEQIWQQLELQNEGEIAHFLSDISTVLSGSENEQADESKNSDHDDSIRDSEERESEDEEFDLNEEDEEEETVKRVRFNLTNDSDETDSLENKANDKKDKEERMEEDVEPKEPKSTLEVRQERLSTRIKELEDEAVSEKPWQLKGEVSGPNRPHNSLLEEFVVVDINTRPAPVITEETTMKLEDIIKQRIKDKAWDDVEKKFKPVETPLEYKKKLILNQEKSKESLSQIYEREYLRQKQALDPEDNEKKEETPQLHNEIRQTMRSLISKLDALSNYHYTPRMAKPEIKIISNVPAVNMEEVAPVTATDATLLAPEEIKTKQRGDLISKSERTKTDMKRERRRKKSRQRAKQQAVELKEKLKALQPGIAKKYKDKKEKAALVKKITKDKNITKLNETTHKVAKSSTAFFTQLQDQVKSKIKIKKDNLSKKKTSAPSAIKLKL